MAPRPAPGCDILVWMRPPAWMPLAALLVAAPACTPAPVEREPGFALGATCREDGDCRSRICWDYSKYDQLCGGKVCSMACATDEECRQAATQAGADTAAGATCGSDKRCDLVGSGLGRFTCA
jgi:hypothetical protein